MMILAVITNNASNDITFLQEVSSELADNIEFNNNNQHVHCLAHIINLAVGVAIALTPLFPTMWYSNQLSNLELFLKGKISQA